MRDSKSTSHITSAITYVNTKSKIKTRGATILNKVKKVHESDVLFPINFDVRTDKDYGEHAGDFRGYLALQGRSKVSILINNWHDIDGSVWTDITGVFIILDEKMVKKKWLGLLVNIGKALRYNSHMIILNILVENQSLHM
ncbi:unnamed protein product [Lathyrus oleraceus]